MMIDLTLTPKLTVFSWVEIDFVSWVNNKALALRAAAERKNTLNL